ncbi:MAG: DUF2284 domain-containing protein [Nanoarchaeota archaeon]|nr:DUF2284 domain-containing protein [Nanoarchaeota archaeon]
MTKSLPPLHTLSCIKPQTNSLSLIHFIKPKVIPFDLIARLKCFQCGLYARALLCPPYVWQTYSQFKTYESTIDFVSSFDWAILLIWKNDGTKSWKPDPKELSHITFKRKFGKQLKGTEVGMSKEIIHLMRQYRNNLEKKGFECFGLVNGHCDFCAGKCPNRDHPPCKRNGMPSLEAIGIDLYRLLEKLKIDYEYPVINYLTLVTMLLIKEKGK